MYSVHQPWDPLRVCVVGKSYPPEFYSFIKNLKLRSLFERIATETEEDFLNLVQLLEKFNVKVVRPNVPTVHLDRLLTQNRRIPGPISMIPRDQMIMIGSKFFVFPYNNISIKSSGRNATSPTNWTEKNYLNLRGPDWPQQFVPFEQLPVWIQDECQRLLQFEFAPGDNAKEIISKSSEFEWWSPITNLVKSAGNEIIENQYHDILNLIPANGITRIGRDLFFGISDSDDNINRSAADIDNIKKLAEHFFPDYRNHIVTTGGHIDGCFTPVKPGLIVSIEDMPTYADTFPDWEVVYLSGESWDKVQPFLDLKEKNQGRWWIKGSEYDDELIEYVETWLQDWVGYVEESVFDVNILVIDQQNIVVNGYNEKAFDAFKRHGVTPYICPLRHRYFWDGGVHCVTLDLDRDGTQQDFFTNRV
jgi:N-dimethylarginine dimethylaminohydrolase